MDSLEIIIIIILGSWLFATILYQIFNYKMIHFTARFDIFRWLPAYHLFSGTPRDFKLFYRDRSKDGILTDWLEISLVNHIRPQNSLWNPNNLVINTICSLVDDLVRVLETKQNKKPHKEFSERFIYKSVMRFVLRFPKPFEAIERQFKIEETNGHIQTQSIKQNFVSEFHTI